MTGAEYNTVGKSYQAPSARGIRDSIVRTDIIDKGTVNIGLGKRELQGCKNKSLFASFLRVLYSGGL